MMVKCGQAAVIFKMIAACFITAVRGEANTLQQKLTWKPTRHLRRKEAEPMPSPLGAPQGCSPFGYDVAKGQTDMSIAQANQASH